MRILVLAAIALGVLVPVQASAAPTTLPRIRAVIVSATTGARLAETTGSAPRPFSTAIGDGRGGFFVAGAGKLVRLRADGTLDPAFVAAVAPIKALTLTRGVLVTAGSSGLAFLNPLSGARVHPTLPLAPAGTRVSVTAIAASGPLVFVVGANTRGENGASQLAFGANVTTGTRTGFHPIVRKGIATGVAAAGSVVYLAGGFSRVGGAARYGIASVTAATGALRSWRSATCLPESPFAMKATAHTLFIGRLHGFLALRTDTGSLLTWSRRSSIALSASGVASLALSGHTLYLGTVGDASAVTIGSTSRRGFVALDATSGAVRAFRLHVRRFQNGKAIAVSGARLLAYGSFSSSP
ncbi:MAG: hypothetical protein ABI317_17365 [Gaiellales bacterium]